MRVFSAGDMQLRLRRMLPVGWFGDVTPVLDAVLLGLGAAFAGVQGLIAYARAQTRIGTAGAPWLDLAAQDYLGGWLQRRALEGDDAFRGRLLAAMGRRRVTREALEGALVALTGTEPWVFEPRRPADTGGWNVGGAGYGVAGGWGSMAHPAQVFVVARRPRGTGCALLAGYGTGGVLGRAGVAQIGAQVGDGEILGGITDALPSGAVAWVRLV